MAEASGYPTTTNVQFGAYPMELRDINVRTEWKYKSLKFGPIIIPWYASPEAQLILVSFVCFLCPGKAVRHNMKLQSLII